MSLFSEGHRAAIVAAHPDDETIGVGGCLPLLPAPVFIHVTDGAPRDMRDALEQGFSTREAYAEARRREFLEALRAASARPADTIALGYPDQEASFHLAGLASQLARLFERLRIELVLTHPYEGGHPDHDATAFSVQAACLSLPSSLRPRVVEFTSYHGRGGGIESGVFLPGTAGREAVVPLSASARARKQRMFACFRSQQGILRAFGTAEERFRAAPRYDFGEPPHAGPLFYEQFPWGMTACRWLELARSARLSLPWSEAASTYTV